MMNDNIALRPAQPGDADRAAVLLYSAYIHEQVDYPMHEEGENRFLKSLRHYFPLEGNRCSYQNTEVAEHHDEVVGLVLSFAGREEERLNAAIGWTLAREAQEDEWYIDALAVFARWGRQGIGTRLLQTAEQQARQHGYAKIALNVARENEQALSLYQHLHYVITGQTIIYQHPHVRLVKRLDNG
jgi:ribosomal protein S18 acetylase RimI-like enzyme